MDERLVYLSNPTIDEVVLGERIVRTAVGGPGFHGSWAARLLGVAEVIVVGSASSSEEDLLRKAYGERGVVLRLLPSRSTTRFRLIYGSRSRNAEPLYRADPLDAGEAFRLVSELRPSIIIVAPVLDEVPPSLASKISSIPGTLLALDLQGYARIGMLEDVLKAGIRAAVIHASSDDIGVEDARLVAEEASRIHAVFYYTMGSSGITIYLPGRRPRHIGVRRVEGDPTGAGDVFLTAASILVYRGLDPVKAGAEAAALATRYVEARSSG